MFNIMSLVIISFPWIGGTRKIADEVCSVKERRAYSIGIAIYVVVAIIAYIYFFAEILPNEFFYKQT